MLDNIENLYLKVPEPQWSILYRINFMGALFIVYSIQDLILWILKPSYFRFNIYKLATIYLFLICVLSIGESRGSTDILLNLFYISCCAYLNLCLNLPLGIVIALSVSMALQSLKLIEANDENITIDITCLFFRNISKAIVIFTLPALLQYTLFPNLSYGTIFGYGLLAAFLSLSIAMLFASAWIAFASIPILTIKGMNYLQSITIGMLYGLEASTTKPSGSYTTITNATPIYLSCCGTKIKKIK